MFYTEIFKTVPLKCDDCWNGLEENITYPVLCEWKDYVIEEEGRFLSYLLNLETKTRQNYLDSIINRLAEAYKQSMAAYEETGYKGFLVPVFSCRAALGCLVFRFKELELSCSKWVIEKWISDFPFMEDFPVSESTIEKVWPKELDNEAFKKIIERGIEAKLIEASTSGFKWNETKELLAYFAECISKRFGLSKKVYGKDNIATSWKPFEALFGVNNLKEAKQNWLRLNTMFTPNRYEEIDKLLNGGPTHL